MIVKNLLVLFIAIICSTGCSGTYLPSTEKIPINKLLSELPAQNEIQKKLIFNAILQHKEEGIVEICNFLKDDNSKQIRKVRFALNGLSSFVMNTERENDRLFFVSAIHRALQNDFPLADKTFLIDQLQLCAGDESVDQLSKLLKHSNYFNAALHVLSNINSEKSARKILDYLEGAPLLQKIALIGALGQMDHEFIAENIMRWVKHENRTVKLASLYALSNLGYKPAYAVIKNAAAENPTNSDIYINFAESLYRKNEKETSFIICNEIIKNTNNSYSSNQRINALKLLSKLEPKKTPEYLFNLSKEDDYRIRSAALLVARNFNNHSIVNKWINLAKSSDENRRIEIIELLANLATEETLPYLINELSADSLQVRAASLSAILSFKNIKVINSSNYLERNLSRLELDVLKTSLMEMEESAIKNILQSFNNYSSPVKIVLVKIIAEKGFGDYNPLLLYQLDNDDHELQLAAIKTLGKSGSENDLKNLANILITTDDKSKMNALISAIININSRSINQKKSVNYLVDSYKDSSPENKIKLMKLFSRISHDKFLILLQQEIKNADIKLREAALRTLYKWQHENALDLLIEFALEHEDDTHRILAIRAAIRILNQNRISDPFALDYYRKIMSATFRVQEKRLVFAGLANIESNSSLQYLSEYFNDQDLNYDAFLSAMKLVEVDKDIDYNLDQRDVALGIIKGINNTKLIEKIESDFINDEESLKLPEGFVALFNNKDLSGWKGLVENPVKRAKMTEEELAVAQQKADSLMKQHWKVENGILYFDGKGSSLCTAKDYTNFEMFVDWKIEKEGDSGIYLRGSPQVQIWDTAQWPEGSGGLYNNQNNPRKPLVKADNPIGEWNTFYIVMRGEKVTVFLNEVLVVDNVIMENYWERDKSIYPIGQIELQSHHSPLYFKNIYIKELPAEEILFKGFLFNKQDLHGWKTINNKVDGWKVSNEILYTEGEGGGWLSTEKEYDNFILELEFKLPPGGNSGVFIRAPHEGDPAYTGMEIQILDDHAEKYKKLKEWQYTGSIYGLQMPSKRVTKSAGIWQKMEIICSGPSIKVKLNNESIIDANLIDYMQKESSHPGLKRRKGFIGLQNHSTKVEYKNIKLTEIK